MTLMGLGWREDFAQHFPQGFTELVPARVAVSHRDRYLLLVRAG